MFLRFLIPGTFTMAMACGPSIVPQGDDGGSTGSVPPSSGTSVSATAPTPGTTVAVTTSVDSSDGMGDAVFLPATEGMCSEEDEESWRCSLPPDCSTYEQNCPDGEKCAPWANDGGAAWNANRCVPVTDDPVGPGEACTMEGSAVSGVDDCDASSMCWYVDDETLQGVCVPFCSGTEREPVCRESTSCVVLNDETLVMCLPECQPLLDDCEIPDTQCAWIEDSFHCAPVAEELPAGESCGFINDCASGSTCLLPELVSPSCDQGGYGCCTPLCDLSAPDPAADCFDPAQICAPWWDEFVPAGYEDVGVCMLPQ